MAGWWKKLWQYKIWIVAVLVAAVAAPFLYSWYQSSNKPAVTMRTAAVERGDLTATVSATGTIAPVNKVDISSKITGLIVKVHVNENDRVHAGQILVELDDKHLQAKVVDAQSRLANAEANYRRLEKLSAQGAIAVQEFDKARMEYTVAEASYSDAVSQLEDTVIRAPIDGVVIGKPTPAGQTVAPGISTPMVLMTIADMSLMQIDTQVDESDIGKVENGQKVTFTVDAYSSRTYQGLVSTISHKANIQQNVVYYNVVIDVLEATGLKPTMTARVTIIVGEAKQALLAPLTAIKENKSGRYVQVLRAGQTQNVNVTTGLMNDEKIEILSGLQDGDQLVLSQARPQGQSGGQSGPNMRNLMGR